ncbi:MAG: RNA repair domain-containing protein [Desulfurococcaceae archaeon]|nr:RNA repair domain-containing protein [Desulfurococcaceae archaeon]
MCGKKRGEIEEWLRRIIFSGVKDDYVVLIRHRENSEEVLKPVPGTLLKDVRGGYMIVDGEVIPLHRVEEIRRKNGVVVYKRRGMRG